MKSITSRLILIAFSTLLFSSCASAPERTVAITGKQNWSIIVSPYTGSFVFEVRKDGSFEGISQWSGGSGGASNKINGQITNNSILLTRHLEGRHVGKIQTWRGAINTKTRSASGTVNGRGTWKATIN